MFETVIAAMLKHKQVVFAAIAVTAIIGYIAPPAGQVALAQGVDGNEIAQGVLDSVFGGDDDDEAEEEAAAATEDQSGDDNQDIDQTADQTNEQEQDAEQEVEQNNDQSETNIQANELDTGDNTATVAQSNDAAQEVTAATEAAANAEAASEAESEDDGDHHDKKGKKHHSHDGSDDITSSVADAEAIVDATATATGIQTQSNTADVDQDSSIHDVDLSNNVAFGDDTNEQVAIPIIDQDQRAANLAIQAAANLDLEEEIDEYGEVTPTNGGGGGANLVLVCERQGTGANSPIGNAQLIPAGSTPPAGFSEAACTSRTGGPT